MNIRLMLTIGLIAGMAEYVKAQVGVFGGAHYSVVRNDVLQNDKPLYKWHVGGSIEFTPKAWERFSVELRAKFIQKGYRQQLNKLYEFRFTYLSLQPVLKYSFSDFLAVDAGLDASALIDTNVEKGISTYNTSDFGFVFGLTMFDRKRVSVYSRLVYGLTPMLDYYEIDKTGNFTGEINDLKNICILVGLRINVYREKISF